MPNRLKPTRNMEEKNQLATLVIQHHMKPSASKEYESWLKEIAREGQRFKGHLGANVIRPFGASRSYTIVVRFDSQENLLAWMKSEMRHRLIQNAQPLLDAPEHLELQAGLDYWFTPDSAKQAHAKPFKQFLITLSAIFPLIVVVPWALQPLLAAVPLFAHPLAVKFVVAVVVVLLMVYVIMPRYVRLVAAWLYK